MQSKWTSMNATATTTAATTTPAATWRMGQPGGSLSFDCCCCLYCCCCCCCLEALEAKQSHKPGRRLFQSKILITAKMLQHSQSALKTETQTHNVAALSTHSGDCSFYSHSTGILRSHYQEQQQEQAQEQAQAQLNATIDMAH